MSDAPVPRAPRARLPVAIVLAAGTSRRMGARNKLLLPLRGKPLAAHVVQAARTATGGAPVVVTGHERERVEAALREALPAGAARFAHNPNYRSGMASSLRRGVAAAPTEACGYLVCLGDQPRVTTRALALLCERFRAAGDATAIITFAGVPGPPVLFGGAHRHALLRLPGSDTGAQRLLREHADAVVRVPPAEAGLAASALAADIDTPAAYNRLTDAHD